jgi:hypothetical protein
LENKDNWSDDSIKTKKGQLGFVDKSFITLGEEGFNVAKVRIREERLPAIGDKMACALPTQQVLTDKGWIEIKDIDLGESSDLTDDEPRKKGQRITYIHQLKFSLVNVGRFSLKDVIFSVKDIYNDPKEGKVKKKSKEYSYMGRTFDNEDVGAYNNIEVNTLNLKSKKLVYVSNLPTSFGVGDYYFDIIVEWNNGFYQMHVDIEEVNGKLKYRYQFYDVDGKPINLKSSEEVTA